MKFITHYTMKAAARNEAIKRFRETGGVPPEGVKMHARWHAASGNEGWALVETADVQALTELTLRWSDLLSFDITPVVEDEEFVNVLNRTF